MRPLHGHAYLWLNQQDRALQHLSAAIELDEARVKTKGTPRDRMDTSYDYVYMGTILRKQGRFNEALEWERKAEEIRQDLAKADPHDRRAGIGLAETDEQIGALLGKLGRVKDGLSLVEGVVRTREKYVADDPESTEDRFDLAHVYMEVQRN
jgi:tetratricopeptide (TPR) repeat protein